MNYESNQNQIIFARVMSRIEALNQNLLSRELNQFKKVKAVLNLFRQNSRLHVWLMKYLLDGGFEESADVGWGIHQMYS